MYFQNWLFKYSLSNTLENNDYSYHGQLYLEHISTRLLLRSSPHHHKSTVLFYNLSEFENKNWILLEKKIEIFRKKAC